MLAAGWANPLNVFSLTMTLKAVLFDFNGVILDDEPIHQQIIMDMMAQANLPISVEAFQTWCLGRSDRVCFPDLFNSKGKTLNQTYLLQLLNTKAQRYQNHIATLDNLPLFPGVKGLLDQMVASDLKLAIVSGARRSEVQTVLQQAQLSGYFSVVVTAEDITVSKPEPDGYQLAVQRLSQQYPALELQPADCLAIEDSFAGIEAAKQAQLSVVGVAHTLPFHMLQRHATWTIDYLDQLELDRIQSSFTDNECEPSCPEDTNL